MNNGGIPASALAGGFDAWQAAGFAIRKGRER
jgi:rhodanese-related sulfurtransferase